MMVTWRVTSSGSGVVWDGWFADASATVEQDELRRAGAPPGQGTVEKLQLLHAVNKHHTFSI
jgi:hypothetical protein